MSTDFSFLRNLIERPGMFFGKSFDTIDEFRFVFGALALAEGINSSVEKHEELAVQHFPTFMRYYLFGCNANRDWCYELLSREGNHEFAIQRAGELLQDLASRISDEGEEKIDEIIKNAQQVASPDRTAKAVATAFETIEKLHGESNDQYGN